MDLLNLFVTFTDIISCYLQKGMVVSGCAYVSTFLCVSHPIFVVFVSSLENLCSDLATLVLFWDKPSQICLSLEYFLISVGNFSVLQVLGNRLTEVMHLHLLTRIYMWPEEGFSFTFSTSEFHYLFITGCECQAISWLSVGSYLYVEGEKVHSFELPESCK